MQEMVGCSIVEALETFEHVGSLLIFILIDTYVHVVDLVVVRGALVIILYRSFRLCSSSLFPFLPGILARFQFILIHPHSRVLALAMESKQKSSQYYFEPF